jgi:O-antigen/teichoic acid export membrane protein
MAGINALISISDIDAGLYDRQVEGIRALISIANEVAVATRSRETISSPTGEIRKQSRLSVLSKLRQDEMTWNSLFLVLNTGLQSGSGFIFWFIAARLFIVSDVGKGSALISGVSLIGNFALLGLNMGMGKYLPNARNRDALISSGLGMVATVGALGAMIYILLTPFVAPGLAFVGKSPVLFIGFALITSAFAVNTLTDNIFIASRKAKYTVLVDGVIGGFGKVALTFVVAGAGAYGLFLATSIATAFAAGASLLLIFMVMRVRIDLKRPLQVLKPLLRFSGANYIANIFSLVAGLVIPIIVLDRLGADSAAYYFVALQMAQIVYTAGVALEQTFLTEGSRPDADMRQLRRRSLRLLVVFFVSAAVIMIGLGRFLLLAFGESYYQHGYMSLVILVLAAGPISATFWLQTILRLANKLRAIIVVNTVGSIATCLGVWFGSAHGLEAVALGWLGGNIIEMCIAAIAAREWNVGPEQRPVIVPLPHKCFGQAPEVGSGPCWRGSSSLRASKTRYGSWKRRSLPHRRIRRSTGACRHGRRNRGGRALAGLRRARPPAPGVARPVRRARALLRGRPGRRGPGVRVLQGTSAGTALALSG